MARCCTGADPSWKAITVAKHVDRDIWIPIYPCCSDCLQIVYASQSHAALLVLAAVAAVLRRERRLSRRTSLLVFFSSPHGMSIPWLYSVIFSLSTTSISRHTLIQDLSRLQFVLPETSVTSVLRPRIPICNKLLSVWQLKGGWGPGDLRTLRN